MMAAWMVARLVRSPRWRGITPGFARLRRRRIHHVRVSAADVRAVTRGLLAQTRAERAAIGVMHPGRGARG